MYLVSCKYVPSRLHIHAWKGRHIYLIISIDFAMFAKPSPVGLQNVIRNVWTLPCNTRRWCKQSLSDTYRWTGHVLNYFKALVVNQHLKKVSSNPWLLDLSSLPFSIYPKGVQSTQAKHLFKMSTIYACHSLSLSLSPSTQCIFIYINACMIHGDLSMCPSLIHLKGCV